jgi:hypothetical protein
MHPVSASFGSAVRRPHSRSTTATHRNLVTGATTTLTPVDGSITEDAGGSNRWTLSMTLPPVQAVFDALDTPGGEITVAQTLHYVNGATETVPMGVYIVDQDGIGYSPGDTISITAVDRSLKIQRNKMAPTARSSVPSNMAWQEIKRLVEGAWPGSTYRFPGWSQIDTTATAKVGSLVWDDGDRWSAITDLCSSNSLELFFDDLGLAVLRKVPVLTPSSTPVWKVDAGSNGVFLAGDRSRDRSRTRNVVIVSTSATDVAFDPVVVADTTFGDPLNTTGPLGYVPYEYSSPTLRNSTQAQAAGKTILMRQLGTAATITMDSVSNFALRAEDVITVTLPRIDRNTLRPSELHILDTVAHPISTTGSQSLATRSTRPDTDGS